MQVNKINFKNNSEPAINGENLNQMQTNIENAIKEITGETVELYGSGRTDAGVHSLGQIANFKTESNIELSKIPIAINSKLKKSIVIISLRL